MDTPLLATYKLLLYLIAAPEYFQRPYVLYATLGAGG